MKIKKIMAVVLTAAIVSSIGVEAVKSIIPDSIGDYVRADSSQEFAEGFAERMYTIVLGRDADEAGVDYWVGELVSGRMSGADCAVGFFDSQEFKNQGHSDSEFVTIAYNAILNREAADSEIEYWTNWLDRGMTRNYVLNGFIDSAEFRGICNSYHITSGTLNLTSAVDRCPYTNAFVNEVYNGILGRDVDSAGLNSWVSSLVDGGMSASSFVECLIYSDEFKGRHLSDEDYVRALYEGILGRTADDSEVSAWLNGIYSRPLILTNIIQSSEFTRRCSDAGIVAGSIDINNPVERTEIGREYASHLYESILGREIDGPARRTWENLFANGEPATTMIRELYSSEEFADRRLGSGRFLNSVYRALLNRDPYESEISYYTYFMDTYRVSRSYIIALIVNSDEFVQTCQRFGVNPGTYETTEARDINPKLNEFIINIYNSMLDSEPATGNINGWANNFINMNTSGAAFLRTVCSDGRFTAMSRDNQIRALYIGALGREASSDEVANLRGVFNNSGIDGVIDIIVNSSEFENVCNGIGISPVFANGWNNTSSGRVYFDGNDLISGWQRIDGNRYYFDPDSRAAYSGWHFIGGLKYYFDPDTNALVQDVDSIIGMQDSYYLTVNCATNVVMIYAQDVPGGDYNIPVRAIACSTGLPETPTIQGDYRIHRQGRWHILAGPCWGQFCTNINGNYLFHSSWYYEDGNNHSLSVTQYNRLGQNASHGCVRLTTADARWIYEHCDSCIVHIYTADDTAPFDKPVTPQAVVISGDRGYDPTDPWA